MIIFEKIWFLIDYNFDVVAENSTFIDFNYHFNQPDFDYNFDKNSCE